MACGGVSSSSYGGRDTAAARKTISLHPTVFLPLLSGETFFVPQEEMDLSSDLFNSFVDVNFHFAKSSNSSNSQNLEHMKCRNTYFYCCSCDEWLTLPLDIFWVRGTVTWLSQEMLLM